MKSFCPLPADESERIAYESLVHYQDAHIDAEAVADAALHDAAEFSCQMRVWQKGDVEKLAALNMIAHEAEERHRVARHRLVLELCDSVAATLRREEGQ